MPVATNHHALCADLKDARGEEYFRILNLILTDVGKDIVQHARNIKRWHGKVTLQHIGGLCVYYDLPVKAVMEYLEKVEFLPTGTYEKFKDNDGKAREIIELGRKWLEENRQLGVDA